MNVRLGGRCASWKGAGDVMGGEGGSEADDVELRGRGLNIEKWRVMHLLLVVVQLIRWWRVGGR